MALDAYPASAALSPASIFSAASSCIPGITWLAPAAAIILQPKCAVRDCLRWDALGIRPQILAANGYTSCDCAGVAGFLWACTGRGYLDTKLFLRGDPLSLSIVPCRAGR